MLLQENSFCISNHAYTVTAKDVWMAVDQWFYTSIYVLSVKVRKADMYNIQEYPW